MYRNSSGGHTTGLHPDSPPSGAQNYHSFSRNSYFTATNSRTKPPHNAAALQFHGCIKRATGNEKIKANRRRVAVNKLKKH